ncbi:MAG: cell division protein ZapA [Candidatus Mcinerneyibacterium aminivorans]|jgi:cell division protein ZapA (FtsZ GTPase activity inhibitor)|uniref:Cell division protein ZapA n=1 Tax=Candidatus Mcinerneyibacterium aminivorans TaxID=2703815 RepID=A0A5D0MN74_9BACT|nr:MAG: cell division protein ZapA [Candidatus Mcinerneyibacterium aminivorans]
MNVVEIEVFGKTYKLKSDKPQEEFNEIIKEFNRRVEEMSEITELDTPRDVLVLTLLNIIEEYLDLKKEKDSNRNLKKDRVDDENK